MNYNYTAFDKRFGSMYRSLREDVRKISGYDVLLIGCDGLLVGWMVEKEEGNSW